MARGLDLLFVIDPLGALILETETTLLVMEETRRRSHVNHVARIEDLYARDAEARVVARPIELDLAHRPFYRLGPASDRPVASFDLVLVRKDPPVEATYRDALALLLLAGKDVPMINDPAGLLGSDEKLMALEVPGVAPPTVVTADPAVVAGFVREHEEVVVKPLGEYSGRGIRRFSTRDGRLDAEAIGELATHRRRHVVVQRFLPEVVKGDKRIFVLDGEPLGWVNRVPEPGSFRANIHQGARVEATEPTDREREAIAAYGPLLEERGLALAGFDFIGGWLTEVNVTSPSALRQIDRVMEARLEEPIVDFLEARAAAG